jgi:hypothetical protein
MFGTEAVTNAHITHTTNNIYIYVFPMFDSVYEKQVVSCADTQDFLHYPHTATTTMTRLSVTIVTDFFWTKRDSKISSLSIPRYCVGLSMWNP